MTTSNVTKRLDHLSFKGNLKDTRYGWLRMTPAYSIHLVSELLEAQEEDAPVVLDPFCGTGTTALVCAERGIECDTIDINPFLLWLGQTKTQSYSDDEIEEFVSQANNIIHAVRAHIHEQLWIPPLHQIEKWWGKDILLALARAMHIIVEMSDTTSSRAIDLLKIAFCRTMIDLSNVSFGHQSMSFKQERMVSLFEEDFAEIVINKWRQVISQIAYSARSPITVTPRFLHGDARHVQSVQNISRYSCVITSPPYPNRISYIRELRPYMYWLRYLSTGKEAGELDWQAIGGTWGCATSNLNRWTPDSNIEIPFSGFHTILNDIASNDTKNGPLLSRYVHKYFYDMVLHCRELFEVIKPEGIITYIVGNSKFYDVLLPVDAIFASIFKDVGFRDVSIRTIRKRTSKKELFEFAVSARK